MSANSASNAVDVVAAAASNGPLMESLVRYLHNVLSPDANVQRQVTEQFAFLAAELQAIPALLSVLLNIGGNAYSTTFRQTAGLLLKRVLVSVQQTTNSPEPSAASSATTATTIVASIPDVLSSVEDRLLVALSEPTPILQTTVGMVVAAFLSIVGLRGWPTLLPRVAACALAGASQGNPLYIVGVARCLCVLFEDAASDMAALCEDPMQLSALCDVLETCLNIRRGGSYQTAGASPAQLVHAMSVWKACNAFFSSGVVPQSEHVQSGCFGASSSDDDFGADGPLCVMGTSPQRLRGHIAAPRLSRAQRRMRRDAVMQRLRRFVDSIVDSLRAETMNDAATRLLFLPADAAGEIAMAGHPGRDVIAQCELVVIELTTQLVGFWGRAERFVSDLLPLVLQRARACVTGAATQANDGGGVCVVVASIDLVTELAQSHEASPTVERHLADITDALLHVSVLSHEAALGMFGGEDNAKVPDDPRTVLGSLTRRGAAFRAHLARGAVDSDAPELCTNGPAEQFLTDEASGESEGAVRDAVGWSWNCLATSFPDALTTTLIPILVHASMHALAHHHPMQYEAVLFTLSELVDELFAHIPASVMTPFLQQCESVLHSTPPASGPSFQEFGAHAIVRRQAIRCLERAAVGFLTLHDDLIACDDDGEVDGGGASVEAGYVLSILLRTLANDHNKLVQLAALRGIQNIVVHALHSNDSGDAESSDGADGEGADDGASTSSLGIEPAVLCEVFDVLLDGRLWCALQLRSRVALHQTIAKVVEADMKSLQVVLSSTSNPAETYGERLLTTYVHDVQRQGAQLYSYRGDSTTNNSSSSVAELLASMSTLCDLVENLGADTVAPQLSPLWSVSVAILNHHRAAEASGVLRHELAVYRDEVFALAMDVISSCCDALLGGDSEAHTALIVDAFCLTDAASLAYDLVLPPQQGTSTGASSGDQRVDPNLRRACFGLLGDVVTSGAAAQFSAKPQSVGILDAMLKVCVHEAIWVPYNQSLQQSAVGARPLGEDRWGSMDARSNALYCTAHLLGLCDGDANRMLQWYPSSADALSSWVCPALLQQLDKDAVDNIHRTMKLNVLYALAMLAPMVPAALCSASTHIRQLLVNAAYFLPVADDEAEILQVLGGIARFLHAAMSRPDCHRVVEQELLHAHESLRSVAKLLCLFSKKALSRAAQQQSAHGAVGGSVSGLWKAIGTSCLVLDGRLRYNPATDLGLTSKEGHWVAKFLTT